MGLNSVLAFVFELWIYKVWRLGFRVRGLGEALLRCKPDCATCEILVFMPNFCPHSPPPTLESRRSDWSA